MVVVPLRTTRGGEQAEHREGGRHVVDGSEERLFDTLEPLAHIETLHNVEAVVGTVFDVGVNVFVIVPVHGIWVVNKEFGRSPLRKGLRHLVRKKAVSHSDAACSATAGHGVFARVHRLECVEVPEQVDPAAACVGSIVEEAGRVEVAAEPRLGVDIQLVERRLGWLCLEWG